ncbi:MAG: YceI family protein [Acidobacteria bacterium]|nr:YceI family protein [Acidobacteriota bacterium]
MKRLSFAVLAALVAAPVYAQTAPAQTPPAAQPPAQQQQRPPEAPLGPNQWRIDGNHSAAHFSVRHLTVSTVRGQLGRISGTVEYDGKDISTVKADVAIDVNSIDTHNENRDKHLRTADFFDAATHPTITFKSKRAEPATAGRFKLIGDLTIRGTTKEVVLDVEGPSPVTKTQRGIASGATATTKINRLEYGLKWNNMIEAGPVVSDEVTVTIDLELTRPAPPGTAQ